MNESLYARHKKWMETFNYWCEYSTVIFWHSVVVGEYCYTMLAKNCVTTGLSVMVVCLVLFANSLGRL